MTSHEAQTPRTSTFSLGGLLYHLRNLLTAVVYWLRKGCGKDNPASRRSSMAKAPEWAVRTVERVCAGERRYRPELRWHIGGKHRFWSSGHCVYGSHIVVTAVKHDRTDTKTTLYHELTHWVTGGYGCGDGHPAAFYATMFRLVATYAGSGLSVKAAYAEAATRQKRNATAGLKLYRRRKRGLPDPAPKPRVIRVAGPTLRPATMLVRYANMRGDPVWHVSAGTTVDTGEPLMHTLCGWSFATRYTGERDVIADATAWPPRPHCSRCQTLYRRTKPLDNAAA